MLRIIIGSTLLRRCARLKRLWIDMSDIFFDSSASYTAARKIAIYCYYDIPTIRGMFFYEVAPICDLYTGGIDHGESLQEDFLVQKIKNMLNNPLWTLYNKIFKNSRLEREFKTGWDDLEVELKRLRS